MMLQSRQLVTPAESPSLVIEPAHHLTFGQPPEVSSIAFHPDGAVAWVHSHEMMIDVWRLCLVCSPYWAGAVGAFAALVALFFAWRIRRTPREPGRHYCRRCNYDVTDRTAAPSDASGAASGLRDSRASSRCPECGIESTLRTSVLGRPLRRRLVAPGLVLALIAVGYGSLLASRASLRTASGPNWKSASLWRVASDRNWGRLTALAGKFDLVEEIDLRTGRTIRTLHRGEKLTHFRMTASPDGRRLYLEAREGIAVIDTRTGRTSATIRVPRGFRQWIGSRAVVHHDGDGLSETYLFGLHHSSRTNDLRRWSSGSDVAEVVFSRPAYERAFTGPVERTIHPLGADGPGAWLSAPTFMEAYSPVGYELRVLAADGAVLRTIPLGDTVAPKASPAVTPDGRHAFLPARYGDSILGIDLESGESIGRLRLSRVGHIWSLTVSQCGRFLYAASDAVWVRDLQDRRWAARLAVPPQLYGLHITTSPCGNWLAVRGQRQPTADEAARGVQYAHDLVIWDLAPLHAAAGETPETPSE